MQFVFPVGSLHKISSYMSIEKRRHLLIFPIMDQFANGFKYNIKQPPKSPLLRGILFQIQGLQNN